MRYDVTVYTDIENNDRSNDQISAVPKV